MLRWPGWFVTLHAYDHSPVSAGIRILQRCKMPGPRLSNKVVNTLFVIAVNTILSSRVAPLHAVVRGCGEANRIKKATNSTAVATNAGNRCFQNKVLSHPKVLNFYTRGTFGKDRAVTLRLSRPLC